MLSDSKTYAKRLRELCEKHGINVGDSAVKVQISFAVHDCAKLHIECNAPRALLDELFGVESK